jgi:hypothetical protein
MIQGCMSSILEATPIILTEAERVELEGLARSTKTEYRLRQRARIVLAAADGMASRAIGRTVGCTTGTASKWRARYAERRVASLGAARIVSRLTEVCPGWTIVSCGYATYSSTRVTWRRPC